MGFWTIKSLWCLPVNSTVAIRFPDAWISHLCDSPLEENGTRPIRQCLTSLLQPWAWSICGSDSAFWKPSQVSLQLNIFTCKGGEY
ncbi:hypothetical protein JTE90_011729 [Oedothorax gibbosus]|uniref:Uncharacterized protein n=1 Tax=Oedothorax gibbosus TaxID=931172 RepID=A0AAV6TTZ0_9ARAC|nr:hypothetical protein JTE90_011729 [Oedothorax gibbosus]